MGELQRSYTHLSVDKSLLEASHSFNALFHSSIVIRWFLFINKMLLHSLLLSFLASYSYARSVAISEPEPLSRRAACAGNTATTRSEWCDYNLQTNYYDEVPDTGVTREYYWSIVNTTLAPDGRERQVWSVNGSFPGPTIIADWGDTIVVHVTNELDFNGTTIHWHGIRQNQTNPQDGVPAITECPTKPSGTKTYTWRATQYGTTWWHSHIGVQAWDGVAGGIIINGPASANYDTDLGTVLLNDWDIATMDSLLDSALINGPPTLETGLINGTNTYGNGSDVVGHRFNTSVTAGDSYRIRLVNAAIDTTWKFSIDNHTLQVIAADLTPIEPYYTDIVTINIGKLLPPFVPKTGKKRNAAPGVDKVPGQRYDLVVTANESATASDFWIRSIPQLACSNNANPDDILGIFHYGTDTAGMVPRLTLLRCEFRAVADYKRSRDSNDDRLRIHRRVRRRAVRESCSRACTRRFQLFHVHNGR